MRFDNLSLFGLPPPSTELRAASETLAYHWRTELQLIWKIES